MVRAAILFFAPVLFVAFPAVAAPIERVWLSHASHDPSRLVINWETSFRVAGIVEFGADAALGHSVAATRQASRHHVTTPLCIVIFLRCQAMTLPGNEWSWYFDMPTFDLRLIAVDLNHIQDHGTTWQTCHAWQPGSSQLEWYAQTMEHTRAGFILTIMNEKQTKLQQLANASWHDQFRKGSGLITGFGYFAERARLEGNLPYFNTSLKGTGDLYKDPSSQFHAREDNYLLITARAGAPVLTVEIKNLQGKVLDRSEISRHH